MKDTDYRCVNTVPGIKSYIAGSSVVAFDFETAPLPEFRERSRAALDPHMSDVIGCSFSVKERTGIYVPIGHKTGRNIDSAAFWEFFGEFAACSAVKIAHNLSFESQFSYKHGIVLEEPIYDTIAASQMTMKNTKEFRTLSDSGLKRLSAEILGDPIPTYEEVTGGRSFDELDPEDHETVRYGCADSDVAFRLYHVFNEWFDTYLPRHRYIVERIESPTSVYLGIMKYIGVPLDHALMESKWMEVKAKTEELKRAIAFIIGDVQIGANCSTKAFKKYLYETLDLPVLKTTASDREAADDQTMVLLKEWCDENRPELSELFILVQEYRKWNKIGSTYINGYEKFTDPATGRIHPDFLALSTETGRLCCRNPNCQNMPRKTNDVIGVRNFIRAPEGHLIMSLDFSQIELRVGAFYCRDEAMLNVYRTGADLHAMTTSVIFEESYEDAKNKDRAGYKEHRTIAKNVNFGTFYGLFPRGLQRTLRFKAGVSKTLPECEEIIKNLKAGYPGLTVWQEETKQAASKRKYTETWLGRRRYLPGIASKDWGIKSFAERCALNTPVQGTAADILKLAIGRILKGLPDRPWLQPILQIHDELTFIVPEEKLSEAVTFVRACMEEKPFPEFDLPLIAEASAGPTFGSMEELD